LLGASVETLPINHIHADNRPHAFEISNITTSKSMQTASLVLAAGSQLEAEEWVRTIQAVARQSGVGAKHMNFSYESFEVILMSDELNYTLCLLFCTVDVVIPMQILIYLIFVFDIFILYS
jgi:hypothetical protein